MSRIFRNVMEEIIKEHSRVVTIDTKELKSTKDSLSSLDSLDSIKTIASTKEIKTLIKFGKYKTFKSLVSDYFDIPRVDLFETKFRVLERCLDAIHKLVPDEYIPSLRETCINCETWCLLFNKIIPTPFVETIINQMQHASPEFLSKSRVEYMKFLSIHFIRFFDKSNISPKDLETSILTTKLWGDKDNFHKVRKKWPEHIIAKSAADCYQLLIEYFVFDLRRNINLKETTIEEALDKFLDQELQFGMYLLNDVNNPTNPQARDFFKKPLLEEWERKYQYQKTLQDTLAEIHPFPQALCFMMGDKLMGTSQVVSGEASFDIFSVKTPIA